MMSTNEQTEDSHKATRYLRSENESPSKEDFSFGWLQLTVGVAILLLLAATFALPSWYYQLLRWLVCSVFLLVLDAQR